MEMAAASGLLALLLVLLVTAFPGGAGAQGPTPSPSAAPGPSPSAGEPAPAAPDCMTILLENLSPCLTYVQSGSNLTAPEKACCGGLATVVSGEPLCLCTLLSASGAQYGFSIDRGRALGLPSVCKVKTPPLSLCSATGAPAPSPTTGAPATSPATGGGGTAPAQTNGNGVGPGVRSSVVALLAGLAFAAVGIF